MNNLNTIYQFLYFFFFFWVEYIFDQFPSWEWGDLRSRARAEVMSTNAFGAGRNTKATVILPSPIEKRRYYIH